MKAVLLTGAGFTFNWGGWLAAEMNTAIAGRLQSDAYLADLLHKNPNFEEALASLQNDRSADAPARLAKLEAAIVAAFDAMNASLAQGQFEFTKPGDMLEKDFSIVQFLSQFDALFTLNQDMLLETHYLDPHERLLMTDRRWNGSVIPGTEISYNPASTGFPDPLGIKRRPVANPQTPPLDGKSQPYFKLHGSTNFINPDGGHLLIMGGNKPTTIARHPLLTWYLAKFEEFISKPNARLMVIGYGFMDQHINQIVERAWEAGGKTLTLFIVSPSGRQSVKRANPSLGKVYVPSALDEVRVLDCTRSLRDIFANKDKNARDLLWNFAAGL